MALPPASTPGTLVPPTVNVPHNGIASTTANSVGAAFGRSPTNNGNSNSSLFSTSQVTINGQQVTGPVYDRRGNQLN